MCVCVCVCVCFSHICHYLYHTLTFVMQLSSLSLLSISQGLCLKLGKKQELFSFESQADCQSWKSAIENALGLGGVEELLSEDEEEGGNAGPGMYVCICTVCMHMYCMYAHMLCTDFWTTQILCSSFQLEITHLVAQCQFVCYFSPSTLLTMQEMCSNDEE